MYKYFLKRLLMMVPILLGVSFIVFSLLALAPGDPAYIILGASADQEALDQLNHELGFDQPFLQRYFNYVYNLIVHFNFGDSYRSRQPVMNELKKRIPVSISLSLSGILLASIIGVPLGVLSAVKQYTVFDTVPTILAMLLSAFPSFWMGMLLIYYVAFKLSLFPSFGIGTWKHYVLPTTAIGMIYAARLLRYTRSSMLDSIRQDYVRTARAKGAPERVVIWKHALRNALLPTVTVIGTSFGLLIGGTIVMENLFSIPGLGSLVISGINQRDIPVVMATTLVIATFFCFILLIMDLLYAVLDPRIKAKYVKKG